jgi:ankyrin repeat protein
VKEVQRYLADGADVNFEYADSVTGTNSRTNTRITLLHYAALEGHIEVCKSLLAAGANVQNKVNEVAFRNTRLLLLAL